MKRVAGLGLLLSSLCVGCSGATTADQETSCPITNQVGCAQPRGVYRVTYSEREDGTCGPKPDLEITASSTRVTRFDPPCLGTVHWDSDFCSASFEVECPEEETGPGFTNHQESHTTYTEDALMRTGTFAITIFDANGDTYCESTYDTFSVNTSCQP